MKKDKLRTVTVYLNEEEYRRITTEAADNGVTVSARLRTKLGLPMIHRGPPTHKQILATLLARQEGRCVTCRRPFSDGGDMEVVHMVPLHLGGNSARSNLQLLCKKCNVSQLRRDAKPRLRSPQRHLSKSRLSKQRKKSK
jgi:hypothetical protein